MITIKSERELELMRRVCKLVADILVSLSGKIVPGISLSELDAEAERLSVAAGAQPAFKGYLGYKHTLCTSVNEQVVHGIPTERRLSEGDIVGIDFGLVLNGYYGDSAVSVPVGKISQSARKLMTVTREALYNAIEVSRAGNTLRDIAAAIEGTVVPQGYSIVREFVGHGIGQKLHEDPQIPNYIAGASSVRLKPGMTIAIEPMINAGSHSVRILSDHWTAVTEDGSLSAHFEHTLAITDDKPEILTEWPGGRLGVVSGKDLVVGSTETGA